MKKLLVLFLLSAIISCKKDKSTSDNECNWQCNDVLVYDSLRIINDLSGTWLWTRSNGGIAGESCETIGYPTDVLTITFNVNGTYTKTDNGLQSQGNWQIADVDPNTQNKVWGLITTPEDGFVNNSIPQFCSHNRLYLVSNYFIIADGGTAEYERQ